MGTVTTKRRQSLGLCPSCGGLPGIGKTLCGSCLDKCNDRQKLNTIKGNCQCGREKIPNKSMCVACRQKGLTWRNKQKENGICTLCSNNAAPDHTHCYVHMLKQISLVALGHRKHWKHIGNLLLKQNNECKYCKIYIQLGMNAEVDHIQPIASFPDLEYDLGNIQWLCKPCNRSKSNKTEQELRQFAEMILEAIPND